MSEPQPVTRAERTLAVFGIAAGILVVLIAADILTGQALSRRLAGRISDREIKTFMEAADAN